MSHVLTRKSGIQPKKGTGSIGSADTTVLGHMAAGQKHAEMRSTSTTISLKWRCCCGLYMPQASNEG